MDGGPIAVGPTVPGTVTVNPGMTTGQVPPRYMGLSYEPSHLTDSFFTGSNAPLIAMLKLLGPSVVRFGGASVEYLPWQPTAQPTTGATLAKALGTADVDNLRDLLSATGWTAIFSLPLKSATPAAAGTEAAYVGKTLGSSLYGFALGNEPNFYGWTMAQYLSNWSAEANAVKTNDPSAKLAGPDWAWIGAEDGQFAMAEATTLSLLTAHLYRGPYGTMATLLAPNPNLLGVLQVLSSDVATNHIADGWRFDETNSFYNHGTAGVSNAYGSALWVLDYGFECAQGRAAGLNFHGGGAGQDGATPFYYTPIDEANGVVTAAQPIFYGMLMFTLAGTGTLLETTATARGDAGALNFTAYAVARADGSIAVVLVNKEATSTIHATVDVGRAANSASAIYLEGPSLTALSGVTLAGAGITPAGAWAPGAPIALATSGQVVTVDVPAASAALVRVQ